MDKNVLAEYAHRVGAIAFDIVTQLDGTKTRTRERYFLGLLARQARLLDDISEMMARKEANSLTSVFILFRCLLDDFIVVLYFQTRGMNEADLIKHTASAYSKKFKMIEDGYKINDKHFGGTLRDMPTKKYYDDRLNEFLSEKANEVFFKDVSKRTWKNFIDTTTIVRELPNNGLGDANAHSLMLWKFMSNYVHYSVFTDTLEQSTATRQGEIDQLQEALSYVYKTIVMASQTLNSYGLTHEFRDTTNVRADIMVGVEEQE